nr:MAG TPA: head closure knob [Caudoviricetes sp.]
MSLLDNFLKDACVLMEKKRTPDGASGWIVEWAEGAAFDAAIILDTSMQSRIAEKEGVTNVYTVTTRRSTPLSFHDVFKRLSDGTIFRATSNGADKQSPDFGTLDMCQVTAERWELSK